MAEALDIRSDVFVNGTDVLVSDNSLGDLEKFLKRLVDSEALSVKLEGWLEERLSVEENGHAFIGELFKMDELCQFDFALEGLAFQQVLRMPSPIQSDWSSVSDVCLTVEDFLHSAAQGLWETFWCDDDGDVLFPFFVAGPQELNNIHTKKGPHCVALVAKHDGSEAHASWEHISEFVLLGDDFGSRLYGLFPSPALVSQAVFFGLHLLLSRKMAQLKFATTVQKNADTAYILLINSQGGGVVRVKGDVNELETNTTKVYESAAGWVQEHAHLAVSTVDQVWNRFGSVNWGDVGALQLLLATFCCMEQCRGSPKKTIAEMATHHNVRLQQRRAERQLLEVDESGGDPAATQHHSRNHGEIEIEEVELDSIEVPECMNIEVGTVVWLEDPHQQRGFKIQEDLSDGRHFVYTATALDDEISKVLNVYVGAYPSQLEPSWEDMSTWYQVQRQARVLNVMKQRGLSNMYLPEFVNSGRLLHPGACVKRSPKGRCDHPQCGTPILVTSPVGESLHKIFEREGVLSPKELLDCCHDCLSALKSAHLAGIQHANITPDHVLRVMGTEGQSYHVLVEWGHAILEDKDSPGISLSFSSTDALQEGKFSPASDAESLVYVLFFLCGGITPQFDSIQSALQWRVRAWARRAIQQVLGEASIVLKAFADYVDNLCGTPYAVDYDIWLNRLNRVLGREDSVGNN